MAKKAAARARPAAKKAAAKKRAMAPKKTATRVPAKKTVARVPASRRAPARRVRSALPARRKAAAPRLKAAAPEQRFAVSHLNESDFKPDGLRTYALYRDLGIAAATGGLCQAHVIRFLSPCTDEVRKRHLHEPELQLIYVLKGWIKNELEGQGIQMMSAGSCWLQPPGLKHTVLDYSPDVELLEIVVPADFKTIELT
ncbi:MAG: cupin [Acetobacteraceae bacterium]|nr:cupin [Acetobacteraceae bacterium]